MKNEKINDEAGDRLRELWKYHAKIMTLLLANKTQDMLMQEFDKGLKEYNILEGKKCQNKKNCRSSD